MYELCGFVSYWRKCAQVLVNRLVDCLPWNSVSRLTDYTYYDPNGLTGLWNLNLKGKYKGFNSTKYLRALQ